MSVQGVVRFRGVKCAVYRATTAEGAGGLPTLTWAPVIATTELRVFLDVITDELAQQIFGRDVRIEMRGTMLRTPVLQKDDGIVIQSGDYTGTRFRVTGRVPQTSRPGAAHQELALERTSEVFP